MLSIAFKEWAAVCRALGDGTQTVILRKGGIAESGGSFAPEHPRFWLYPTFFHENQDSGLKPEFQSLIAAAEAARPAEGRLRLSHVCEVAAVERVADLDALLALDRFHVWTADTVRKRFFYRDPGLFVLVVRVSAVATPAELAEGPTYAGCKTWVDLDAGAEDHPAAAVLPDEEFARLLEEIQGTLAGRAGTSAATI